MAINPETGAPAISTAFVYRPFVWIYLIIVAMLFVWFWPVLAGHARSATFAGTRSCGSMTWI